MISSLLLVAALAQTPGVLIESAGMAEKRVFGAKDNQGVGLDCLKAIQLPGGSFIGVHHALKSGVFSLNLIESDDLMSWRHVRVVEQHAHQGTLKQIGDGFLAAWEMDGPGGNWIRIVHYPSLQALKKGKEDKRFDAERSLAPTAEGTPVIRAADKDLRVIRVGMHYYRDQDVDRQAVGVLRDWENWYAKPLSKINRLESDWHGNIGDRDIFRYQGQDWMALEAQKTKHAWDSWRILLGKDPSGPFQELKIRTPGGSKSFANPNITPVTFGGKPGLFVSLFLPSEGNAAGESGQMISWVPFLEGTPGHN